MRGVVAVLCLLSALFAAACAWGESAQGAPGNGESQAEAMQELVTRPLEPRFGGLPELLDRRFVRVLTSYSRSNFFLDDGRPRGFEYEMLTAYRDYLNKQQGVSNDPARRVRMVFAPLEFDRLLDTLSAGGGDIAAAGLTVTPERAKAVDFTHPYITDVAEVVVAHKSAVPQLRSLDDLAGRTVHVRAGSSYVDHLRVLSASLQRKGEQPVTVKELEDKLGTEDILEMVHAGVFPITVADKHIAEPWSKVLGNLRVLADLTVHSGGNIAWAVRKDTPELLASLNLFIAQHKKGTLLGNILYKRYFTKSEWIHNPTSREDKSRLEAMAPLFKRYAKQYDFDWLALAAQAYQESGLDNSKVSAAGAVGVMQLLPSTAQTPPVSEQNFRDLEGNIRAGAKYMHYLRERYFSGKAIPEGVRMDFSWAAYNAGPTEVKRMREHAKERGFDPNRWFYHVERIADEWGNDQVVDYVANINKYYIAYRLTYDDRETQAE